MTRPNIATDDEVALVVNNHTRLQSTLGDIDYTECPSFAYLLTEVFDGKRPINEVLDEIVEHDFVKTFHERLEEIFGYDYTYDNRFAGMIEEVVSRRRTVSNILADYQPIRETARGRRVAW